MTRNALCTLLLSLCAVNASGQAGAADLNSGAIRGAATWRLLETGDESGARLILRGSRGVGLAYARSAPDSEFNDPAPHALLTVALRMPERLHGAQSLLAAGAREFEPGTGMPALALAAKRYSGAWAYSIAALIEDEEVERRYQEHGRWLGGFTLQAEHRLSAGVRAFASFSRIKSVREGERGLFRIGMIHSFGE
jgi:hypothetical protein